jgi:drug/metabolite transporter (DMT)-like permease
MLRKLTSITLLISVIAVGISGVMMLLLGSFTFQLQMHPVHKVFGILMCVSAIFHMYFNFSAIKSYFKINKVAISAAVLSSALILLTFVGMNKPLNQTIIEDIEIKMSQLEQQNQ